MLDGPYGLANLLVTPDFCEPLVPLVYYDNGPRLIAVLSFVVNPKVRTTLNESHIAEPSFIARAYCRLPDWDGLLCHAIPGQCGPSQR